MGTNYYIKGVTEENTMSLEWHIGKRSNLGHGSMVFTWAMKNRVDIAEMAIEQGFQLHEKFIVNEYGFEYTLSEFLEIIDNCQEHIKDSIGTEFC